MHSPNDYLSDAVSIVSLSYKMWPGSGPPFCWEKASVSMTLYLLYVLKLLTLSGTTKQKTPNMGKIHAKCVQFSITVAGYKWSQKVAIFGNVTENDCTIK